MAALSIVVTACGDDETRSSGGEGSPPGPPDQTAPASPSGQESGSAGVPGDEGVALDLDPVQWFAENCSAQVRSIDGAQDVILTRGAIKAPLEDSRYRGVRGRRQLRLFTFDELNNVMTPSSILQEGMSFCVDGESRAVQAANPTNQGEVEQFTLVRGPGIRDNTYMDYVVPKGLALKHPTWETISMYKQSATWTVDLERAPITEALAAPVGSEPDYCGYASGMCGG